MLNYKEEVPSSEESANHRFLSDEAHHCGGSNAAARSKYFPWRPHTKRDVNILRV